MPQVRQVASHSDKALLRYFVRCPALFGHGNGLLDNIVPKISQKLRALAITGFPAKTLQSGYRFVVHIFAVNHIANAAFAKI